MQTRQRYCNAASVHKVGLSNFTLNLVKIIFYSDNLHVDRYIHCQYIQDLTVSFVEPQISHFVKNF